MKILMINAIYGLRSSGRSMLELTNKLRAEGHEVFIASPQKQFNDKNFYRIGTDLDHKIHGFLSRLTGKQAYFSKHATKRFVKFIDEIKPDVIHIQVLHGNFIHFNYFFKAIAKRNIPVVYVLDDCWPFTGKCAHYTAVNCNKWKSGCGKCPKLRQTVKSWFFDRTNLLWTDKKFAYKNINDMAVVAVSDWLLNEARQSIMGNAKILRRIYNSIDTDVFSPRQSDLRSKLGLEDSFVILAVAISFAESKGLSLFIKLANMIPENWKIIFVGNVPEGVNLPSNILSVGLTESISELAEYYSMADVFVQMSIEETFGKVTAEALSCGTPAVVFNSTANPELIGEGCGYVVLPKDVDAVLQKLKLIKQNGKDYYSKSCREFILREMDKDKNLGEFIEIYNQLIKDKKC